MDKKLIGIDKYLKNRNVFDTGRVSDKILVANTLFQGILASVILVYSSQYG